MKAKTIKSVLSKVHKQFVESITDDKVKGLVEANSIITGGSIVSLLLNEKVNDFDFYFTNKETVEAVAKYFVAQFNASNPEKAVQPIVFVEEDRVRIRVQSAGIVSESDDEPDYEYFESNPDVTAAGNYIDSVATVLQKETDEEGKPKHRPIFLTDNAITLSGNLQLVIRFYGSPEVIHENYDFVHAMCWWRSKDGHLELPAKALEAILTKELIYHGSKYPLASIIRTRKFIQRGWSVSAGQYLKMVLQLSDLDLNDVNVLQDQLTGMDAAYFYQVLGQIRERMSNDSDFKLTSTYLIEIIDRIF